MKKLFLVLFLFIAVGFVNSQDLLYTETYSTLVKDTIAINGSTDAGSDWFTNVGYDEVWCEIWHGTYWYTFKIDAPAKYYSKFKVAMEGSDTTVRVQGFESSIATITLPLWTNSSTTKSKLWLDYSGAGDAIGTEYGPATAVLWVQFRGYFNRNLK